MSYGVVSAEKQAEILKDQGNFYFKKLRLSAAIEAYTEAITLCPAVPTYWTNRALCHRKRNDWERVESDCRRALELDKDSVKAHYMLGLALLQSKHYADAVKQLEKAFDLERGGNPSSSMVDEIWQELAMARYTEWQENARDRGKRHSETKELCERLLVKDYEGRIAVANEHQSFSSRPSYVEVDGVIHISDDQEDTKGSAEEVEKRCQSHLTTLREVFDRADASDRPGEVPDHLCCKITMDIFRDPVTTPSGITYERATLMEHMRKVGKFDPVTRTPLTQEQVVPNLAMKEAVQAFLRDHGWAYKI